MTGLAEIVRMQATATSNLRKYQTKNPMVQRLIRRFLRKLLDEVSRIEPRSIIDLGCGEGIVAGAILKEMTVATYLGYDSNPDAIDEARRRNPSGDFRCRDIFDLQPDPDPPDLVLCLEVMEHIPDTERFLEQVAGIAGQHAIISVPWEPFFRFGNLCRGKYVRRLGNHPEHVHCFGMSSFSRALSRHFPHVRVETSFPWLFGICGKFPAEKGIQPRMDRNEHEAS